MYSKRVNDRSPLRVFARSIHGGLGRGNLGVVLSRAGVGKTSFLVGIALDDLMRGLKVFHVALEQSVDHVREYYDEVFNDLASVIRMDDAARVRLHVEVERGRHIHTYLGHCFSMVKLREALDFLKDHLHFEPDVILVDGLDFSEDHYDDISEMRATARLLNAELWMSARTYRNTPIPAPGALPIPLARYSDLVSVAVLLEPVADRVRLRLQKDHENTNLSDLYLDLDPNTMLVVER